MVENPEVKDVVIPLRWCVDRETLDELKDKGVQDPYLLLVIAQKYCAPEQKLVPFNQMLEYVELKRPGVNRIFATIVWNKEKGRLGLWRQYLQQKNGRYNNELVDCWWSSDMAFDQPEESIGKAVLILEVPRELFAKEPHRWEKKWVNLWFENRPKNQCYFRRRRLLAYTIQPPAVFLWTIFVKILPRWMAVILLVILGFWVDPDSWSPKTWKPLLDWRPLVHPWRKTFRDLFTEAFADWKGTPAIFMLSVYIFLPFAIVITLSSFLWKFVCFTAKPITNRFDRVLEVLESKLGSFIGRLVSKIPWPEPKPVDPAELKRIADEREKIYLVERYASYQVLLCENVSSVEPRKVVPFKYKVYLRYMDLKASICKPFAE
jgi:hypothetical protein